MNLTQTIESLFVQALERPTKEERLAYLNEACNGDELLRQEVERLLAAQAEAGDFLESPAPGLAATALQSSIVERPGTIIGPYKLLEQIGEGGFGVVFMAEQTRPVQRKVALKVVKPGMDTRQVIARFEAERQALALMDHPNIARVLDAGATETGRPYFVMDLVRGVPITDYCDAHRLSIRERLELFVTVCQAVQHAHQKGIIHRDIKPTNVLVTQQDGRPLAKVIDFGVAKAAGQKLTDKTLFTSFAQLIGTPLYMSPEQAEMSAVDVDTRSDIYSLGVLLYELLTGATPFDNERFKSAAFDELRRIIREEEPPRPSTRVSTLAQQTISTVSTQRSADPRHLSRSFRGELDWIVMRCLEKDRARRYDTASALAADVEHYLQDEPVEACPPSAAYRFRKFARRYRAALLTISLVIAVLTLGITASTWQAIRANHAEAEAKVNEQEALASAHRSKAMLDLMVEAFKNQDPSFDGRTMTLLEVLHRVASTIQKRFADDPSAQIRLLNVIADSYASFGLWDEASPLQEEVLKLRREFSGPLDPKTNDAAIKLADYYSQGGRNQDAINLAQQMIPQVQDRFGVDHETTRIWKVKLAHSFTMAERPNEAIPLLEDLLKSGLPAGEAIEELASAYERTGQFDLALILVDKLIAHKKQRGDSSNLGSIGILAANHGLIYAREGRAEEVLPYLEALVKDHIVEKGADHPYTIVFIRRLAHIYVEVGRGDDAVKLIEEGLSKLRDNVGEYLNLSDLLSEAYSSLSRFDEAVKQSEQNVTLSETKLGSNDSKTLFLKLALTRRYREAGRFDDAFRIGNETLTLYKSTLPDDRGLLLAIEELAVLSFSVGRVDECLKLEEQRLRLELEKYGPNHLDSKHTKNEIARIHSEMGKYVEAEAEFRALLNQQLQRQDEVLAHSGFFKVLIKNGKHEEARAELDKSLRRYSNDYDYLVAIAWLLADCEDSGIRDVSRAVELARKAVGLQHNRTCVSLLGMTLYRAGDYAAAVESLTKAEKMQPAQRGRTNVFLAMAYWQLGRHEEAIKSYDQAAEWMKKYQPLADDRRYFAEAADLLHLPAPSFETSSDSPPDSTKIEDKTPTTPDS